MIMIDIFKLDVQKELYTLPFEAQIVNLFPRGVAKQS